MKPRFSIQLAVSALSMLTLFSACNKAPSQKDIDDEVNQRVQEKLQQQQVAQQQQNLDQREKDLEQKEQDLANQQQQLTDQLNSQQNASTPAPSDSSEMAVSENIAGNDAENEEDYTPFYDSLQGDGDWIQTDDYGYVWQPSIAVSESDWQPYSDGGWQYTDYGWTWISNESFGWATYHYGRWAHLRDRGWIWIPGREWAPAWVSWRTGGDYVGWAPLPPDVHFRGSHNIGANLLAGIAATAFSFVPTSHFYESNVHRYVVPRGQNTTIFNHTTNITNITRNTTNNVVINNGPKVSLIEQQTHKTIRPLKLEREGWNRSAANHQPSAISGSTLKITAPVIEKAKSPVKPQRVKGKLQHVQAENLLHPSNLATPGASNSAPRNSGDRRTQLEQQRKAVELQRQQVQQQLQVTRKQEQHKPALKNQATPPVESEKSRPHPPQQRDTKSPEIPQSNDAANRQSELLKQQQQAQQVKQQQLDTQRRQLEIQRQQDAANRQAEQLKQQQQNAERQQREQQRQQQQTEQRAQAEATRNQAEQLQQQQKSQQIEQRQQRPERGQQQSQSEDRQQIETPRQSQTPRRQMEAPRQQPQIQQQTQSQNNRGDDRNKDNGN